MSILKGILHHWNKTNKAYDTIHPETEVAQITDWNNGVVNTLASTALGSLVTTLSSDSLLAKLIGKVLTASGARYQSGPNGYICFGSYFGSHIIQWGEENYCLATVNNLPCRLLWIVAGLLSSMMLTWDATASERQKTVITRFMYGQKATKMHSQKQNSFIF